MTLLLLSAQGANAPHGDPVVPILIALFLMSFGAALGGRWVRKMGQPAVLGELLIGVIVANVAFYFHEPMMTVLREGPAIIQIADMALGGEATMASAAEKILPPDESRQVLIGVLQSPLGPTIVSVHRFVDTISRIAVIILLFLVGLDTSVREMRKVGATSSLVAVAGVLAPFALGVGAAALFFPTEGASRHIFIGAIFTATSVGITARVFRDLKRSQSTEAKIILGAAVIDDVLGLVILTVVSSLVISGSISFGSIALITLNAALFLAGSIGLGVWLTPKLVKKAAKLDIENSKLLLGLGLAFTFAWLADMMGLATIVGAFAAGLVLEEFFLDELKGHSLRELLSPTESLIVPIFFVLMGIQVKLETLADPKILLLAAALTVAAAIGKIVAGLACPKRIDRLTVGIGMMPRGEVGLIFASIGKSLGVVTDAVFSAVIIMVMVTTLLTPPLLKVSLARGDRRAGSAG